MESEPIKIIIGELRSKHVEEIIQFDGKVIQSSDVRPQVVNSKFECVKCGKIKTINDFEWQTGQFPICPDCNITMLGVEE